MIREDDISTFVTLVKAEETIDNLRCDVNLARMLEERDQADQAEVTDNEEAYLSNLAEIRTYLVDALEVIKLTIELMSKLEKDRKYMYLIGIHHPEWADQRYIRDRDEWIVSDSESEAIKAWCYLRRGWLHPNDRELVKVFNIKRVDAAEPDDDHDDDSFMTEEQFEQLMETAGEEVLDPAGEEQGEGR